MRDNGGFTLVEVVVVAVLVTVLAGAGYATFIFFTKETSAAAANMKGQIQGEALYEAMAKAARQANLMMPVTDVAKQIQFTYKSDSLLKLRRDSVFFVKFRENETAAANPPFAGFRIATTGNAVTVVQEWVPGTGSTGSWKTFKVGVDSLVVVPESLKFAYNSTGAPTSSNRKAFQLNHGDWIKSFETDLTIRAINHRDTAILKLGKGKFSCRI
jgi:prepilin-type N-terminal cleavage/methylation domain-containing protein